MPEYSTYSRFSLIQLQMEERKQKAHLKKLADMQRQKGLNNTEPLRFPHIHQGFLRHMNTQRQEIDKENEVKLKKLVEIMTAKTKQPPSSPPFIPLSPNRHHRVPHSPENNIEYLDRVAKAKGKYDIREWQKEFERHQEYLKIRKDKGVFTPLGMTMSRQRSFKTNSTVNSKRTTPTSSKINVTKQND